MIDIYTFYNNGVQKLIQSFDRRIIVPKKEIIEVEDKWKDDLSQLRAEKERIIDGYNLDKDSINRKYEEFLENQKEHFLAIENERNTGINSIAKKNEGIKLELTSEIDRNKRDKAEYENQIKRLEIECEEKQNISFASDAELKTDAEKIYEEERGRLLGEYIAANIDKGMLDEIDSLEKEIELHSKAAENIYNTAIENAGIKKDDIKRSQSVIRNKDEIQNICAYQADKKAKKAFKAYYMERCGIKLAVYVKWIFGMFIGAFAVMMLAGLIDYIFYKCLQNGILTGELYIRAAKEWVRIGSAVLTIIVVIVSIIRMFMRRKEAIRRINNEDAELGIEQKIGKLARKVDSMPIVNIFLFVLAGILSRGIVLILYILNRLFRLGNMKKTEGYKHLYEKYFDEELKRLSDEIANADSIQKRISEYVSQEEERYRKNGEEIAEKMRLAKEKYNARRNEIINDFDKKKESYVSNNVSSLMEERNNAVERRNTDVANLKKQIEECSKAMFDCDKEVGKNHSKLDLLAKENEEELREFNREMDEKKRNTDEETKREKYKKEEELQLINEKIENAESDYKFKCDEGRRRMERRINELNDEIKSAFNEYDTELNKNGWYDICGFDFRNGWPIIHALATNILGWPVCIGNEENKLDDDDIQEFEKLALGEDGTGVKAERINFMPEHIAYGIIRYTFEFEEVHDWISERLIKLPTFKSCLYDELKGGEKQKRLNFKEVPTDAFYTVKLIEAGEKPIIFRYNFGDIRDSGNKEAELLRSFVLKHTIFLPYRFLHNQKDVSERMIITNEVERADLINININSKIEDVHELNGCIEGNNTASERFLKSVADDCESNAENEDNFYSYALKRATSGRGRFEHKFKVLSLFNADMSKLKNSINTVIRHAKYRKYGIYMMIFIDEFRLNSPDTSDSDRDFVDELEAQISGNGRIYRLAVNSDGDGLDIV